MIQSGHYPDNQRVPMGLEGELPNKIHKAIGGDDFMPEDPEIKDPDPDAEEADDVEDDNEDGEDDE